ncbi:hypothetical protein [Oryzobacter terrae]|uniref:hypothetical protein n=1 Tax=Oryzobacter terrae TaxID=1620385 RepID=UPI003671CB3A
MNRLRTSLVVLAVGGATVTTGVVATSALATPAPVAAVEAAMPGLPTTAVVSSTASSAASSADAAETPGRAARGWWRDLTDAQQTCLRKEVGTRPLGPLSDAERQALRAKVTTAADACDVKLPLARARAFWDGLTDEQRQCLREADLQRPWGPLTKAERQAVRADLAAAAKECGVTPPETSAGRP